jgi:pimeloyl-ACP methyl ester carboxylesterase
MANSPPSSISVEALEPGTTLVILPGLDGTDVFFRPLRALLPANVRSRVVSFPKGGCDYASLLELVREAVADVPQFYVLGSSFSGPLAVMLAAAEPKRVCGIILAATFVRPPREELVRWRFAAISPVIWMLRAARRIPVWTSRRRDDPLRVAKAETWARVSARCLAGRVRSVLSVDAREALRACCHPILAIAFDGDEVVPHHNANDIQQIQPTASIVRLPGSHLALFTDPEASAREIIRFIRATRTTARSSRAEAGA